MIFVDEYNVKNYESFNDASSTTIKMNDSLDEAKEILETCDKNLSDDVFMGPSCEACKEGLTNAKEKISSLMDNFLVIKDYLEQTAENYKNGDENAAKEIISIDDKIGIVTNKSTSKEDIDLASIKEGTKVWDAANKYASEIENADYATVRDDMFAVTTTEYINGQPVEVTHIIINNPDQINGAPANGTYGSGLEKSSDAAKRLNSSILINGSHFNSDGTEDLRGQNHIAIVNGQIKRDGVSGGNELLLDNKGNIYNAYGKSAQQLVNDGVKYSFSCHSTQVIENGNTSPSYREGRLYKRTVIGQVGPGEYYITTDTNANNRLSDTAEYLKNKGCVNAYSLDQGGSVSLVRNNDLINNPSDSNGERAVGDFLYFT